VLHAGHTRRDRAREARQLLEKVKANIVGVVLNGARLERGYTYRLMCILGNREQGTGNSRSASA
jgi:Mrp family chromosome partitioning ATPase